MNYVTSLPGSKLGRARAWVSVPVSLALLCAAFAGHAAEDSATNAPPSDLASLSLQELMSVPVESVSTASMFPQKITEAPASVSVITEQDIKIHGYRSVAEMLQSINGVYASVDYNYDYLGIRGFNLSGDFNNRVLILIDGHRCNDPVYGSPILAKYVDVDMIERVELVRSPSSSLYGDNAFLAVINIITRKPESLRRAEVSVDVGSYNSSRVHFATGGVFTNTGIGLVLSGSMYNSRGNEDIYFPEFNSAADHYGVAHHLDWEHAQNALAKLSWKDFTLEGGFANREKAVPTAAYSSVFNDPRNKGTDVSAFTELKYNHAVNEETRLMLRGYYDYYGFDGVYPSWRTGVSSPVINRELDFGHRVGAEAQVIHNWNHHTLTSGVEVRDNVSLSLDNHDEFPAVSYMREDRSSMNLGAYAQDQIILRPDLLVNVGVRYDWYETFGNTINPRASVIYSPWEGGSLKAIYGTAYRAPNAYELYANSDVERGNGRLKPEGIQTYELSAEQRFLGNWRASVSGYYYAIDDLITQTLDNNGYEIYRNLNQASAKGLEAELETRFKPGFAARLSYALQRVEDNQTGATLNNSPRHLAKIHLTVPVYPDYVFSGIDIQYTGRCKTLKGNDTADFWILNWNLYSQRLIQGVEISAGIYNLFDTRCEYPGRPEHAQDIIVMQGRALNVKLTYRF